jgi:acetyl-CoA carboxylase carboxyl transferase subunit beta
VIVHGDVDHAPEMAAAQGVGALSLLAGGDVHGVVPELDEDTPESLARAVAAEIAHHLAESARA